MARFLAGDIVFVPVPFVDGDREKRRPALVLASWTYGQTTDYLLCPVTSGVPREPSGMPIRMDDYAEGSLPRISYLRPYYLLAKTEDAIAYRQARLTSGKLADVKRVVRELLS